MEGLQRGVPGGVAAARCGRRAQIEKAASRTLAAVKWRRELFYRLDASNSEATRWPPSIPCAQTLWLSRAGADGLHGNRLVAHLTRITS